MPQHGVQYYACIIVINIIAIIIKDRETYAMDIVHKLHLGRNGGPVIYYGGTETSKTHAYTE